MGTAAGAQFEALSLTALRQRAIGLWLTALGLLAFAVTYVSPMALALRQAPIPTPTPLPRLMVVSITFPKLLVPKPESAPAVARTAAPTQQSPASKTAAAPRRERATHRPQREVRRQVPATKRARRTVPVVSDNYSRVDPRT